MPGVTVTNGNDARMMKTNIQWIYFDLGWTLVDETAAHHVRLGMTCEQLAQLGKQHTVEELTQRTEAAASTFAPSPFRGMLEGLGLSEDQIDTVSRAVRYGKEEEVLFPGVPEVLAALAEHYTLAVMANQSAAPVRTKQ